MDYGKGYYHSRGDVFRTVRDGKAIICVAVAPNNDDGSCRYLPVSHGIINGQRVVVEWDERPLPFTDCLDDMTLAILDENQLSLLRGRQIVRLPELRMQFTDAEFLALTDEPA